MPIYLDDYHRIKQLEKWCEEKGLVLQQAPHSRNTIAIMTPVERSSYAVYPSYSRGVSLVDGSVEDLLLWVRGYEDALRYLMTIGIDSAMVQKHEAEIAGKYVMDALKKD